MSEAALHAWPLGADRKAGSGVAGAAETTPGGAEAVTWVVIWRTNGLLPAQIMADRLQAEGIPARAWQEGAGRALGLTVGLLGTGNVSVPRPLEEQAREILSSLEDPDVDDEAWSGDEEAPP